jgi:two-component system NtrC family sensor kinase
MRRGLTDQLVGALLLSVTAAAVIAGFINFQQQRKFRLPEDGAIWVDRDARVEALHVPANSPAGRAGLRTGDELLRINGYRVGEASEVTKILLGIGAWQKADYLVRRSGVEVPVKVTVAEHTPPNALYYQYLVALAYLAIGLFVFFRRGSAERAVHFYILCLASFILCSFHYTGKLNNFDKVIYWGNVVAGVLAPTLFLHFCLTFPAPRKWMKYRASAVALYLPAGLLLALYAGAASGVMRTAIPLLELRWLLDRVWMLFLTGMYLLGAAVLSLRYRRTGEDPIVRQQLKWLRNGAVFGILPFAALYALPYALGVVENPLVEAAVLSLPLVPLTWAWAIVRYRLMDVDVIFQQGYVHTLATLSVLGVFYGLIFSLGKFEDLSSSAIILLILIATFIFQPIRNWIQEQLDRYVFYKESYDYRLTLIEFARELGSETDLPRMLTAAAERIRSTLSIDRVGFFLAPEDGGGTFRLELLSGAAKPAPDELDLSFLPAQPSKPYLFFERTRGTLDVVFAHWPLSVRQTVAALDLTYYIPCVVRGRTIAYLGASRTLKGEFLTSDDLELLQTISGYLAIAIENARLYRSLQHKVEEYERLKEFSENIVESINVGILAADLEDRVESWNSRMEQLTGISREQALGKRLCELFPPLLCEQFEAPRGQSGIHHIYKFTIPAGGGRSSGNGQNGNGGGAAVFPREITCNIAIAPLVAKDARQIGRLIIFDDITERAELERQLIQADKLSSIGLLAAGVAHEVNTPLTVISTYAQMLARQMSGDDPKAAMLEKIARQTFRASEIVNSLLNFSRTSTTDFEDVDLNRVVRETASLIEPQLSKAGVKLELECEEPLPPMRGNAGKLQQVFLNLFLNARDAMEGGGTLSVKTWTENGVARVSVSDTGQGIPPELVPRIYDPFFTTKPARKGTGLGLAVTYGIVKEHGGSIEVESRPGAGTCFRLEFPLTRKPVHV